MLPPSLPVGYSLIWPIRGCAALFLKTTILIRSFVQVCLSLPYFAFALLFTKIAVFLNKIFGLELNVWT